MERIIIKNFGGIDELDIELKPINIFIGKQASGKSVTVKLVYFFKTVFASFFRSTRGNERINEWLADLCETFERFFPEYTWNHKVIEIQYFWNNEYIKVSGKKVLKFEVSAGIQKYFEKTRHAFILEKTRSITFPENIWSAHELYKEVLQGIQKILGEYAGRSALFIPAGRSSFAYLDKSIFNVLNSNSSLDIFIQQFGDYYEKIKSLTVSRKRLAQPAWFNKSLQLGDNILAAGYSYDSKKTRAYLRYEDGRKLEIAHTASGQQELLPLVLSLRSLQLLIPNGGGYSLIIEEPEAHIFPSTQREIVELMSLVFNQSKYPVQYFITTHSPYILTSFNNLLYAGVLEEDEKVNKEELYTIIPKEQILKRGTVAAFEMSGGTAKSIMSEETGMIFAEYLDRVSEETSIQFDKLLDLMP